MSNQSAAFAAALGVLLAVGCNDEPTVVFVRFTTDDALAGAATALNIRVLDDTGTVVYDQTRPDETHTLLSLPASVHVIPRAGRETLPFTVEGTLRDTSGSIIGVQRLRAQAVLREQRELWLCFEEACSSVTCGATERCLRGVCTSADLVPRAVGEVDERSACGLVTLPDGGTPDGVVVGEPAIPFSEIQGGSARADGVEAVTVSVVIRDAMNRPVPGVTPTVGVMSSDVTIDQNCQPTDGAGVSICDASLRSTRVQTAVLEIVTPIRKSGGEAVFEPPWIYRSVGPGATAALVDGASGDLSIASSRATFPAALPPRAGVGDALTYDSDGDGTLDALAFVHERISGTDAQLRDSDGLAAAPTSAPTSNWELHRAYAALADAESGTENAAIEPSLANFDAWATGGENLVTRQRVWHLACYGDAPDTRRVTIDGWTTSSTTYVRVFTPYRSSEVGESQRHEGVWSDRAYRLDVVLGGDYSSAVSVMTEHVRVEGLQVHVSGVSTFETGGITIATGGFAVANELFISDNLVVGDLSAGPGTGASVGIWVASAVANTTIWNNIVLRFRSAASSRAMSVRGASGCVSHNTVSGSGVGILGWSDGPIFVRNNVSFGNAGNDYEGTFAPESHHNAAPDGTAPAMTAVMMSSADPTDYFRGAMDLRIDPSAPLAAELIDRGGAANATDPCPLPSEALASVPRPSGAAPDLGAYEIGP